MDVALRDCDSESRRTVISDVDSGSASCDERQFGCTHTSAKVALKEPQSPSLDTAFRELLDCAVILDVHSGSSPGELSFWMCTRDPAPASCHFGCGIDNQPKEPQSPRMQDSESCCTVILDTALHTRDCATVARQFRDTSATPPRRRAPELEHLRNSQSQRLTDNKRAHWTHRFAGTRLHSPARFESQLLKRFCTELAEQPKV